MSKPLARGPHAPSRVAVGALADRLFAFIKSSTVEIGVELDAQGFAEHSAECAILQITRLEDLPSAKAA